MAGGRNIQKLIIHCYLDGSGNSFKLRGQVEDVTCTEQGLVIVQQFYYYFF